MLRYADDYYDEVMNKFAQADCSMLSFYDGHGVYKPSIYAPDNDAGMRQFVSIESNTQQIIGYFSVQIRMRQAKYMIIINFDNQHHITFIQDLLAFINLIFTKYKASNLIFCVRKDHPMLSKYKNLCYKHFNIIPKEQNGVNYIEWTLPQNNWLIFIQNNLQGRIINDFNN